MGGFGSGRWAWHDKKTAVVECLILDAAKLARDGMIQQSPSGGSLVWRNTATGEQTASASYRRELVGDVLAFRLLFTVTGRDGKEHGVDERIALQTTLSPVGAIRWWFTCPFILSGRTCGRRVGKLYLPPGGRYFGCRQCHDLSYTSSQESHKYDRLFGNLAREAGIAPSDVRRLLSGRD